VGLEWLPEPVSRPMGQVAPQAPSRQITDGQRLRAAVAKIRYRRLMYWKLAIAGTIIAVGFVIAAIEFLSV
jgi:hypothetical protein